MSNIVDAYPREGAVFGTKPLFQWDYGQIVRLHISDLPATYKVEFSNSTRADAVPTVQTTADVIVPAQLLESGNPVYAWVVVVDEARTTEYSLIIPVSARAKPTDTEPTPEEQSEIDQAIAALNHAVEQTAAMQIVTSEANPQGVYSNVTGFPIKRDSRDYEATTENPNGNEELALIVAQADYADAVKALSIARNRAGWAVTL